MQDGDNAAKKCKKCGRGEEEGAKFRTATSHGRSFVRGTCTRCEGAPRRAPRKTDKGVYREDPSDVARARFVAGLADPEDFDIDVTAEDPNDTAAKSEVARLKQEKEARARAARLASNTAPLRPGDLAEGSIDAAEYDRQRRQEYTATMGEFGGELREMAQDPSRLAEFVSLTAEQERRWVNNRLSRSVSIGAARELLMARQFEAMASRVRWPATPVGYASKRGHADPARRLVTLFLSDLHIGATQPADEVPEGCVYDFEKAGRRLAHLALQCAEFKTTYRDRTGLNLCFAGDIIEGILGHAPQRDSAPLTEQIVAAAQMLFSVTRYLAAAFPSVSVICVPGNHGRNKLVHEGRALSTKWDSFETVLYGFIKAQCAPLQNVHFSIPKAPAVVLPLFDRAALITHGDTELALKSPAASGGKNSWGTALSKMNSQNTYGRRIDLLAAGHFHDPAVFYFADGVAVANGALVPPSGFARAGGMGDGLCGQQMWESVPGFAYGDARFLRVGPDQDTDSSLDSIVPQFTWEGM